MSKTYQLKTQCKGDIHSSKTANIILPGHVTEYRWMPLHVQNRIHVQMHPWMLVETTRVTEFEYYFACTRKVTAFTYILPW